MSFKEFEERASLSNGSAAKISETVRRSTVDRISKAFPDLNTEWLLTGEGGMLRDGSAQSATIGDHSSITGNVNVNGAVNADPMAALEKVIAENGELRKLIEKFLDEIAEHRRAAQSERDRLLALIERLARLPDHNN